MTAKGPNRWTMVVELLARPYPTSASVVIPFIAWCLIVPGYLVVGAYARSRTLHMPELALDRAIPLEPSWSLVYGSLYFAVFLPLLLVREEAHIVRTLWAYVLVWIVGLAGWLAYPTILVRPSSEAIGEGFFAWALRIVYLWDEPYNCFPSLHVAQAFLAALTCSYVSRGVGLAAAIWASLIAISTLFTKQHYVADVIAGIVLALAAFAVFLRDPRLEATPRLDRRMGPVIVMGFIGLHGLVISGFWVAFHFRR